MAEAIGIQPVTLSRLETGDRALSVTVLCRIAEVLQVGLGDLVDVQRAVPEAKIDPEEGELLRLWRGADADRKDIFLRVAREIVRGKKRRRETVR